MFLLERRHVPLVALCIMIVLSLDANASPAETCEKVTEQGVKERERNKQKRTQGKGNRLLDLCHDVRTADGVQSWIFSSIIDIVDLHI